MRPLISRAFDGGRGTWSRLAGSKLPGMFWSPTGALWPVEALYAALLQEPAIRLPNTCRQAIAWGSGRKGPKVSEVLMQIQKRGALKARFLSIFSGVLPQDHTWATMRQ